MWLLIIYEHNSFVNMNSNMDSDHI
jgi:hypothetical protein